MVLDMASPIQADLLALHAMASRFRTLGDQVAAASTPRSVEVDGQATAAAVTSVNATVAAAGATLSGRMQATADKVTAGATSYAVHEARSQAAFSALTPPTAMAV